MILLPVEKQKLKGQSGVKYFGSLLLYYNYMQMLNYIHLTCIYRCDEINSSTYILFKLSLLDQHESKGRGEGTITSYYYKFGCAKYHKYYKTKGYHLKLISNLKKCISEHEIICSDLYNVGPDNKTYKHLIRNPPYFVYCRLYSNQGYT